MSTTQMLRTQLNRQSTFHMLHMHINCELIDLVASSNYEQGKVHRGKPVMVDEVVM